MKFKLLSTTVKAPKRSTDGSAGFDLFADNEDEKYICWGCTTAIETSIAIQIPYGYVGFIKPRSGLAFKSAIDTMAGVIDSDYRGEVKLLLTGESSLTSTIVNRGDKIAQLVVVPCDMSPVEIVDELDEPGTRDGGFGSTGNS